MDDLAYVRERVPDYGDYSDETTRHMTDEYLRAFIGERLNHARERLAAALDERTLKTLDELVLHCQFTDQKFIRWIDHVHLEPPVVAALLHVDRELIELAVQVETATAAQLPGLLEKVDIAFEHRREPLPT